MLYEILPLNMKRREPEDHTIQPKYATKFVHACSKSFTPKSGNKLLPKVESQGCARVE